MLRLFIVSIKSSRAYDEVTKTAEVGDMADTVNA